jgi:hypothetical protein
MLSIASCSFVKDVQKHCEVKYTSVDVQTGSFDGCLKCDSLAKVVKAQIEKAQKK